MYMANQNYCCSVCIRTISSHSNTLYPLYNNSNNTVTLTYVTALHVSPLKLTKLSLIVHNCYGFSGSQIMIAPEKLYSKRKLPSELVSLNFPQMLHFFRRIHEKGGLRPPPAPQEFPPLLTLIFFTRCEAVSHIRHNP